MQQGEAKRIIEALLFVFGQPVAHKRLAELLPDLGSAQIRQLVETLSAEYTASQRAFQIQEVAGGYQLVTDQQLAPWIKRALQSPRPDAVSVAALETLAIVAYRQPMTKAEIEAIRGVDVTASLDTLTERRFVRVVGRKETPGRPFLYGTTTEFLRHFGLRSLDALPSLGLPTLKEMEAAPARPALAEFGSRPAPSEPVPAAEPLREQDPGPLPAGLHEQ